MWLRLGISFGLGLGLELRTEVRNRVWVTVRGGPSGLH